MQTTPRDHDKPLSDLRKEGEEKAREPRPWTAPDFVERSTCAEIGAYTFQEK